MGTYRFDTPHRHNKTYKGNLTKYRQARQRRETFAVVVIMLAILFANVAFAQINKLAIRSFTILNEDAVGVTEIDTSTSTPVQQDEGVKDQKSFSSLPVKDQVRQIIRERNFKWESYLMRLIQCESNFNPNAININKGGSTDRGLLQWNNYYHPEVSDECAYDVRCSTEKAIDRINAGYQSEWVCNQIIL